MKFVFSTDTIKPVPSRARGFTLRPRAFSLRQGGFTLIELMISIAILVIMTSVMLLRQRQIDSIVRVRNTATEIVQMVRQAQVYGINKKTSAGGLNSDQSSFGVYFDIGAGNQEIILFEDKNHNGVYNTGTGEMIAEDSRQLPHQIKIISISGCSSPISVTFTRPFPDAHIKHGSSSCSGDVTITVGDVSRRPAIHDWKFTISPSGRISKPVVASTP